MSPEFQLTWIISNSGPPQPTRNPGLPMRPKPFIPSLIVIDFLESHLAALCHFSRTLLSMTKEFFTQPLACGFLKSISGPIGMISVGLMEL